MSHLAPFQRDASGITWRSVMGFKPYTLVVGALDLSSYCTYFRLTFLGMSSSHFGFYIDKTRTKRLYPELIHNLHSYSMQQPYSCPVTLFWIGKPIEVHFSAFDNGSDLATRFAGRILRCFDNWSFDND